MPMPYLFVPVRIEEFQAGHPEHGLPFAASFGSRLPIICALFYQTESQATHETTISI
jgi:hypothetical protein